MNRLALAGIALVAFAANDAHAGFAKHSKTLCPSPVCRLAKKKIWVEGHYEVTLKKVWVPGHFEKMRVGFYCYKVVWVEGCFQTQRCKVWVPGHWVEC